MIRGNGWVQHKLRFGVVVGCVLGGMAGAVMAAAPEVDVKGVVKGNTAFAFDLYARLRTGDGNLAVSPYSISTALAMTYAGARNETAKQMAQVLHFEPDPERLGAAFAELDALMKSNTGKMKGSLNIANALWGQRGEPFLPEFLSLTKKYYGAGLREVDFAKATEQARGTINDWVADQTQQKIKELLKQNDVDAGTALVLTNAIYFKAQWASRFDKKNTREGVFRVSEDKKVNVPMMSQTGTFSLAAGDDLDAIELPYEGGRLSMVILLPKKVTGLAEVEKLFSSEKLDSWLGRSRPVLVHLRLPRFKFGSRFDLAQKLEVMGMPDAFHLADFSGMNGGHDLFISKVIHQVELEVNEEGTEAAAATAVVMSKRAAPSRTAEFNADHPFVFLIRDRETGSILFMGRVVNPAA